MFGQQIKSLRKENKMSQAELAKQLKVTQQAIGKWETGKSTPDTDTLKRLAEIFKTSVDFLLGVESAPAISNSFPFEVEYEDEGYGIPVIGTVRAGYNALAYNDDYGYEYANVRNPEDYFYLIVKGDSMEPRIKDGDLALVHKQPTLNDGDLGVIVYGDNEGTLKKFSRRGNTIILSPFNPDYEPKIISGEDLNNVYIAGKVVETKTKW
ncbi:MAG: helix-turn-helix domain-containing protein [Ruminococcaceae bacterium]|nr:helix-turn-helix domain-containing protein [Oscillospiraceae bacterium]